MEARGAFKVPSLLLPELEALGLSGLNAGSRRGGSSPRQNLFPAMSIQNRFSVRKQVGMKSQQRSSVFAVHSAVGRREVPDHKS